MMWNWIAKASELSESGQPFVVVTITNCNGSTPREVGAKMIVLADRKFFGTIGGGHLESLALDDALMCLSKGMSQTVRYPLGAKAGQCCGGTVEVLMEVVNQGPLVYVFGAGHVGQAICRTLVGTPFKVHVIDEREEWVLSDALSPASQSGVTRHHCEWSEFVRDALWDESRTYAVVMTHRHDLDQEIIADLVRRSAKYIGLIGSKAKWERIRQRLSARGFSESELSRVRCPIGLDIGGKSPQEVAISFSAEILARYYQKS